MVAFREFRVGDSGVVMDTSFLPVIINTWFGTTVEKVQRESMEWLGEYLVRLPRQAKLVIISDTRAFTASDPKSRKVAAEVAKKLEPHMRAHSVSTIVIISNPLVRAALKAVNWISDLNLLPAKDLEEALRMATKLLESAGQRLPPGLTWTSYRPPTAPMEKSA
jgi:hypothetical protein